MTEVVLKDRAFALVIPSAAPAVAVAIPYAELEKIGVKAAVEDLRSIPEFKAGEGALKILCTMKHRMPFVAEVRKSGFDYKVVQAEASPHIQYWPVEKRLRLATVPNSATASSTPTAEPVLASGPQRKTRVLIVDDSPTIQKLLRMIVESDPQLEVAGVSGKPLEVKALIEKTKPDVMTLDIHMPDMTGVELLRSLPKSLLVPTIVITSLNKDEGPLVFEALENGALDYIQKPSLDQMDHVTPVIVEKLKALGSTRTTAVDARGGSAAAVAHEAGTDMRRIIAIGSSTGGTEALRAVLTAFPSEIPPVVCVQHIPPIFSAALAQRLNSLVPFEVKEAVDGDLVTKNRVLIAPGGYQMKLVQLRNGDFKVQVDKSPPVNRHQPSVDVLFDSVAKTVGRDAVGVIMTGMGSDGAKGLKAMRDAGARTVAQNEETCVVFGMPKEAIRLGGAEFVEPLGLIPRKIFEILRSAKKKIGKSA